MTPKSSPVVERARVVLADIKAQQDGPMAREFVQQHFQPKGPVSAEAQRLVDAIKGVLTHVGFQVGGLNSRWRNEPTYARLLGNLEDGTVSRKDVRIACGMTNLGDANLKLIKNGRKAEVLARVTSPGLMPGWAARVEIADAAYALRASQTLMNNAREFITSSSLYQDIYG